jgi:hypothetical protein
VNDRLGGHWPLFGLRLRIGDLELRPPSDDDLGELVAVASAGVHAPETMPFLVPWTHNASPEGLGIGTAMRAAVLGLAFDGLGALEAASGAFTDNPQSAAVSRKLGYTNDGRRVHVRRGERAVEERFVLHRDAWYAQERPPVGITGLEPCLDMF